MMYICIFTHILACIFTHINIAEDGYERMKKAHADADYTEEGMKDYLFFAKQRWVIYLLLVGWCVLGSSWNLVCRNVLFLCCSF